MSGGGVNLAVDFRNFAAPLNPVLMGHLENFLPAPVGVIGQKGAFLVELVLSVQPYPMASIKFTGTSTSCPQ